MCARPANPKLRDEILVAAQRIVEDCGPECVTMREVAQKVGYSSTTLYLYFKDKRDILREVLVRGFADWADFSDLSMVGPTPLDKFRQRCRAHVVWGLMHPGLYKLMLEWRIEDIGVTAAEAPRLVPGLTRGGPLVAAALEAGQLKGIDDPEGFGNIAWAALHGITSLAVSRRLLGGAGDMKAEEYMAATTGMADDLVNGLLAPYLA